MSTAAVIGAPPAPVGRRVLAALIDGLGTALCAVPIWLSAVTAGLDARGSGAAPVLSTVPTLIGGGLLLVWGVVQWVLHGTKGWTVGRRLLGLRVVDALTGRPIGLGRALVRALIVALGSLACGVGQWVVLASVFWDPTGRRRGWHDRIAEAIVVDLRAAPASGRMDGYRARPAPSGAPSGPGLGDRTPPHPNAAPWPSSASASAPSIPASPTPSPARPFPTPSSPSPSPASPTGQPTPAPATQPTQASPAPSQAAWPPASSIGTGPLSGATPAVPRRPGDPVPPEQTRWAGMVAAGGTIPEPGLVLPPLRTPYPAAPTPDPQAVTAQTPDPHAARPQSPGPDVPSPGSTPDDPAVGAPHPGSATDGTPADRPDVDHSVDDLPAWTGRPTPAIPHATVPPRADQPSGSQGRSDQPASHQLRPGPVTDPAPSTMRDTTQIPTVPTVPATPAAPAIPAIPAVGPTPDPDVPPMDSFWSDPTPTGSAPVPTAAQHATGAARPASPRAGSTSEAPAGWAVRLPDGSVLDLDPGPVLIGRNPAGLVGLRTVAVQDPGMSVSKTHLVVGADAAGAWVMDRASTNGTLVTLPDGEKIVCLPDQRVRVAPGSVVFFGDLSLTVGLVDPA